MHVTGELTEADKVVTRIRISPDQRPAPLRRREEQETDETVSGVPASFSSSFTGWWTVPRVVVDGGCGVWEMCVSQVGLHLAPGGPVTCGAAPASLGRGGATVPPVASSPRTEPGRTSPRGESPVGLADLGARSSRLGASPCGALGPTGAGPWSRPFP